LKQFVTIRLIRLWLPVVSGIAIAYAVMAWLMSTQPKRVNFINGPSVPLMSEDEYAFAEGRAWGGDVDAMHKLGIYEYFSSIHKNGYRGHQLYGKLLLEKAAEQGDTSSAFTLLLFRDKASVDGFKTERHMIELLKANKNFIADKKNREYLETVEVELKKINETNK
jgi:hypothetical protein